MKEYKTEVVQPLGNHNKPYPCVPTKEVENYLKLDFDHLNPLQSEFVKYLEEDGDLIVGAPTSSGKTLCAELFASRGLQLDKRILYIAPMKALADEKFDEWTEAKHTLSKYNPCILTGDFQFTDTKKKELENSKIIVLTPEMFNSKCRSFDSHKWIQNCWIIIDEAHLIGLEGRGDAEEVAIMQYYENQPNTRTLALSATIPNILDFEKWFDKLSGRKSRVILTSYRPCKLNTEFITFEDSYRGKSLDYKEVEQKRLEACIQQVMKYKKHPMIAFVGSKEFGYKLEKSLKAIGLSCYFHNADIERDSRKKIEQDFKTLKYNILIATSSCAWGLNTPARYVICCHTCFGRTPMHPAHVHQQMGRAGRAGYSTEGDAIIMVPQKQAEFEKKRITKDYKVLSTLNNPDVLMFHILEYIESGRIKNSGDFIDWYDRTFYCTQTNKSLDKNLAEKTLQALSIRKMIKKNDSGQYEITKMGQITTQMYMSPMDVSDWFKNFSELKCINPDSSFDYVREEFLNRKIAIALGRCYSFGSTCHNGKNFVSTSTAFVTKSESNSQTFRELCAKERLNPDTYYDGNITYIKYASIFYSMLMNGPVDKEFYSIHYNILRDIDRTITTLQRCDDMYGKYIDEIDGFGWGEKEWTRLKNRLKYGKDSEWGEVKGVGKVKIEKLEENGIKSPNDLKDKAKHEIAKKILGPKIFEEILIEIF